MEPAGEKEDKKEERKGKAHDKAKEAVSKSSGISASPSTEAISGGARAKADRTTGGSKLSKLRGEATASTNSLNAARTSAAIETSQIADASQEGSGANANAAQAAAADDTLGSTTTGTNAAARSTDQLAQDQHVSVSSSQMLSSDAVNATNAAVTPSTNASQSQDALQQPSAAQTTTQAITAALGLPQALIDMAQSNEHMSSYLNKFMAEVTDKTNWETELAKITSEFETTMTEAEQPEDVFTKFTSEYQKVFRALGRTKAHAFTLYNQYAEVTKEYISNMEQQADGAKAFDQDQQTLKMLKQQIHRAEQMLEQSNKREDLAKNELRQLRHDINTLTTTIKQGVGLSAAQERTINELIATKEQMIKDLDAELEKIVSLRNGLTEISENIKVAETQKREIEREIFSLKERNASKKIEIDMELRNKERLDRELRELRVVVTIKSQEVQSKQDAVNRSTEDISTIEGQIRQQKQMIEKLLRDQESLGTRTVKLQQDYDEQMSQTSQLMDENESAMKELRIKERELANHRAEVRKVTRIKETLLKKNHALEDQKLQAESERKFIRSENDALMSEIDRLHRLVDVMKKNIDDLTREKDILSSNLLKAQTETQKIANMILLQRQQQYNIELEIAQYQKEAQEHLAEAKKLETERDTYIDEAARLQSQCVSGLQDLKEKELRIFEFKRQMLQTEAKHKHQQNLYESVQSERNLYAKQLIESQSEIADMKRKLKIMNFQINGYKDDINSKNAILKRESAERIRLQKDTDQITEEIKTLKNQNELAQAYIRSQVAEESKLSQFVKETEVERSRQENALQVLIAERDNLSAQLIRRNDELTAVYDKIKTQQLSLARGENYYRDKLRAIRILREQITDHRHQLSRLTEATSGLDTMKKTIIRLQNEITQEQMRVKALEEELENPINVHRWRKLEGSNPQAFELIQLLHTLQKKLIVKAKEDHEKEDGIKVQEELYLHLKSMLAKQVGPEAVEQISELDKQLKDKQVQLRHMDTELNMYQAQVREYRYAIEQLDHALADTRKQFLKLYRERVDAIKANGGRIEHPTANDLIAQAAENGLRSQRQPVAPQILSVSDKALPPLPDKDGRNDGVGNATTDNAQDDGEIAGVSEIEDGGWEADDGDGAAQVDLAERPIPEQLEEMDEEEASAAE